jgi:HEPN domain-containing protein
MPSRKVTRLDKTFKANWVTQYEKDLEFASVAAEKGFYEWACYLSQQAAEKAVKSVFFEIEITSPKDLKTHAIGYLSGYVPKAFFDGVNIEVFERDCLALTEYIETARYPGVYDDHCPSGFYTEKNASDAIKQAERVIESVKLIEGNIGT